MAPDGTIQSAIDDFRADPPKIANDNAAVAAAEATLSTDTALQVTHAQTLASAVATVPGGKVASDDPDGKNVDVFSVDSAGSIAEEQIPLAGSVPLPTTTPPPASSS